MAEGVELLVPVYVMILLALLLLLSEHTGSLNLVQEPALCSKTTFLILVHSAPAHRALRQTLRDTWAQNRAGHVRTVFVVGHPDDSELTEALEKEGEEKGDLLQGDFYDSYRNLTTKHLLGLSWAAQHCADARWVLKTDDDQFVDMLHLPRLLHQLGVAPEDQLFLCQVLRRGPERDPMSKWYVSEREYPGSSYPPYCAGWAYLTTMTTIRALLKAATSLDQFWIDDLFVTGVVAATLVPPVHFYDWSYSFLNFHTQMKTAVLAGSFYTPELMVCGDVNEAEIRHVWRKAQKCFKKNCYSLLYEDKESREAFLPKRLRDKLSKLEL